MRRRRVVAGAAAALSVAGCVGGPDDRTVTMLAVNEHDVEHSVGVTVFRDGERLVRGEVSVSSGGNETLAEFRWRAGAYRVVATLDDEDVVDAEFESDEPFNVLDVFVASDGSVSVERGVGA